MKSRLPPDVFTVPGQVDRMADAVAASGTKHHRETLHAVNGLIGTAEEAIRDGQDGEAWAGFAVAVTGAFVRLTAELDQ